MDRILDMFTIVTTLSNGSIWTILGIGFIFGTILQYTRVVKFEKIAGFAMLKDTVVPKMLFLAIGLTTMGLFILTNMGYASYHIKPIMLGGLVIGGIIFGIGMAILGKCPGTGPISIAEGRIDVMIGAIGGLFGGLVFTVYFDQFKVLMGENLGKLILKDVIDIDSSIIIFIFSIILILISIFIPLIEED
jgi:uncharacterized membrane protein YedE/YeeE